MSFVEVKDAGIQAAFNRVILTGQNPAPILLAIGEHVTGRIKYRFRTATAPDGTPWKSNAQSTIENYVYAKGGFSKQTGKILKRGAAAAMSKRPLQGESGDLARQIDYALERDSMIVAANAVYAAMQHFGGTKAEFPNLWGDISARPFMPIMESGALYPEEQRDIVALVNEDLRRMTAG